MPIAVGNGSRVAQVSGNRRTKLEEPAPYALVGNIQTSLRKKILHIPIAQSEPGIEPNGASNDFRWKAVTFEGDGVHPKRLHQNHQIEIRALNVTTLSRVVLQLWPTTAGTCGTRSRSVMSKSCSTSAAGRRPTTIWRWAQRYGPELEERLLCVFSDQSVRVR